MKYRFVLTSRVYAFDFHVLRTETTNMSFGIEQSGIKHNIMLLDTAEKMY